MDADVGRQSTIMIRFGIEPSVRTWERFWFDNIPPHVYAVLRIALGGVALLTLLGLNNIAAFWDLGGIVPAEGAVVFKQWVSSHALQTPAALALYIGCLVPLVLMTVGFQCSFTVPIALLSLLLHLSWNGLPLSGAHAAMQVFVFCLVWADCGAVWSLDSWLARRAGRKEAALVSIAPLRLLRYQVALIYFASGLWKLYNPLWRGGSAVRRSACSRCGLRLLPASPPCSRLGPLLSALVLALLLQLKPP